MNTDFRVSVTFPDHPKTLLLTRLSGPTAVYGLIRLWAYAATHRPNGDLSGFTDNEIDGIARVEGFCWNAREAGFLDGECESRSIHDWETHNGYASAAKARSEAAREAGKRSGEVRRSNARSTDRSTAVANSVSEPSPSPVPTPEPSPKKVHQQAPRKLAAVDPDGCAAFQRHAHDSWSEQHGSKPPWDAAEYASLARAFKKIRDPVVAAASWERFLANSQPFFAGHDPKKFQSNLGAFVGDERSALGGKLSEKGRRTRRNMENVLVDRGEM